MIDKTRLGRSILGAAILAGALGDGILRATPWGLNIFAWGIAVVALAVTVTEVNRIDAAPGGWWGPVLLLCFLAAVTWRDSPVLRGLNLIGAVVTLAMILMKSRAGKLLAAGVMDYAAGVLRYALAALTGAIQLMVEDIQWKNLSQGGWVKRLAPVGKGVAIAFPLLLIFGGLLTSADAIFANLVSRLFDWNVESIITHSMMTMVIAWGVAGFLRGVLGGGAAAAAMGKRPEFLNLGVTEIIIVLGALDALFLGFVLVQFRYFFGGAGRVQAVAGLTYAEYARSGFFELVGVASLVLPLLLLAHWLLRKDSPRDERIFRVLAGLQIGLLFVMITSALQRMRLYQREYGLTELRLYTTAFMLWLAALFAWFAVTVLRGRREMFAYGVVLSGFLVIGGLQAVNPDRMIVRANVEHAAAGRSFDAAYAVSLSADAVPELVSSLSKLNGANRRALAAQITQGRPVAGSVGWRRWNWARSEAERALAENQPELTSAIRPEP
jgi:hypothetical protein